MLLHLESWEYEGSCQHPPGLGKLHGLCSRYDDRETQSSGRPCKDQFEISYIEHNMLFLTDRTPSAPTSRSTSSVRPSSNRSDSAPLGSSIISISRLESLKREASTPSSKPRWSTVRRARACLCRGGVSSRTVNVWPKAMRISSSHLSVHWKEGDPQSAHFYAARSVHLPIEKSHLD